MEEAGGESLSEKEKETHAQKNVIALRRMVKELRKQEEDDELAVQMERTEKEEKGKPKTPKGAIWKEPQKRKKMKAQTWRSRQERGRSWSL